MEDNTPDLNTNSNRASHLSKFSNKKKIILFIIILLVLLIFSTFAIFLVFGNNNEKKSGTNESENSNSETAQIEDNDCRYNDEVYQNGDTFPKGDNCNSCTCENGNISCTDNTCNNQNTECVYNDNTYDDGESFPKGDGCNTCTCQNGNVSCGDESCTPVEDDPISQSECIPEGEASIPSPDRIPCCDGLIVVPCNKQSSTGECLECTGGGYCTKCGDGICGAGENPCNCSEDCNDNTCLWSGATVTPGPDSLSCCEGLDVISCSQVRPDGTCPEDCTGGGYCAICGDGSCSIAENKCNCPEDCN